MTDDRFLSGGRGGSARFDDEDAGGLASTVLSLVAYRRGPARGVLEDRLLDQLCRAALSGAPDDERAAIAALLDARVPRHVISERYIAEAARRLGAGWTTDDLGFCDVTIATARLQGMLRELDGRDPIERDGHRQAPLALIVVPDGEYHTLGAMVLLGQLRRRGVSVRLAAGLRTPEVLDVVEAQAFDMILVSAAHSEKLDSFRDLIISVRTGMDEAAPIVVGGAILDSVDDVRTRVGADFATNDIDEALALCGLTTYGSGARQRVMKG